ncbi:MAG TPA: ketoacyl-ACP synthase III [Bryobacteraceae bacterium]|nr:ketoacyl-ACP synthase III [Bryobacteraceae bacterium]
MSAYLHGFGAHVPERAVSNAELAARLGCAADWIESVSGIRERRWADDRTGVVDLGAAAASDCLARAGAAASQIGLLILASGSAPPGFPAPGAELASRLDLGTTPVIDLPMASAGGLFGLALAHRLADSYGDVLVVAAEKMSAVLEAHPLDRNTAILFGDGAGAAFVSSRPGSREILESVIHSDGQFREDLSYNWTTPLQMKGLSVILQAARKLPSVIEEALQNAKIPVPGVSAFLIHQANQNLLLRVAKSLKVPPERVFSNIARYGNTSSASLLIAAAEWDRSNPEPGPAVFAAFGAGLHWGAMVTR